MARASGHDPHQPIPVIVPVEVRRIVHRIIGYHVLCTICGKTMLTRSKLALTCSDACRQRAYRLRKRQRERLLEEAEEARIAQAEEALRRRRRLPRDLLGRAPLPATGALPGSAPGAPMSESVTAPAWRRG